MPQVEDTRGKLSEFDIQRQKLARDCAKLLVGHGRPPQKANELSLRTAASQNPIDRPDVAVIFVFRHSEADRIPIVIENLTDGILNLCRSFISGICHVPMRRRSSPSRQIERNIGPIYLKVKEDDPREIRKSAPGPIQTGDLRIRKTGIGISI